MCLCVCVHVYMSRMCACACVCACALMCARACVLRAGACVCYHTSGFGSKGSKRVCVFGNTLVSAELVAASHCL